jgi:putative ABC transport system permease protein
VAVVNFVNLSTAQSSKRGKEVGVRKALGAYRLPLLIQSMSESVILCAVSLALGLCHILGSL